MTVNRVAAVRDGGSAGTRQSSRVPARAVPCLGSVAFPKLERLGVAPVKDRGEQ
jgi:hypothetical protein